MLGSRERNFHRGLAQPECEGAERDPPRGAADARTTRAKEITSSTSTADILDLSEMVEVGHVWVGVSRSSLFDMSDLHDRTHRYPYPHTRIPPFKSTTYFPDCGNVFISASTTTTAPPKVAKF